MSPEPDGAGDRGGSSGAPGRRGEAVGRSGDPGDGVGGASRLDAVHDGPIAVFGGVYSNHLALEAVIRDARARGAEALYCLGDLGAFGPNPDRVPPILRDEGVTVMRGNYDDSLARGLSDCQCGYTDPRDNHFARLSYRYTFENTSPRWKDWMGTLPERLRVEVAGREVLMSHGSPRRMNEFLWESTTSTDFLDHLARRHDADALLATHTGIHWNRELPGGRLFANVGCIGRPANDGRTDVWYTLIRPPGGGDAGGAGPVPSPAADGETSVDDGGADDPSGAPLRAEFVPVAYDHGALAEEMREEGLPEEFVETIVTGWWTTCLEVLPAAERRRSRH